MAFSHAAALEYLRRAYEQNRLAHAYLISGSPGSGKRLLAAELASLVNGTEAGDVFAARAREIFVAEPESKSRRIVIEQVRALEHALQMRASAGRCKVAIIAEAARTRARGITPQHCEREEVGHRARLPAHARRAASPRRDSRGDQRAQCR